MTSFVHVEQPATHPGVARAEAVIEHIRVARRSFDGARGLAALLLGAIVASLLVVADKLMSTWNDGGLLVAWLVLWGVAFAAIAFFAGAARSLAVRAVSAARGVGPAALRHARMRNSWPTPRLTRAFFATCRRSARARKRTGPTRPWAPLRNRPSSQPTPACRPCIRRCAK